MKPLALLTILVGILAFQAARPGRRAPGPPRRPAAGFDGRIALNSATAGELEGLPGIGPRRAAAIVELRRARGGFRRLEDLLEVPGLGGKTVEQLRPWTRLDPE